MVQTRKLITLTDIQTFRAVSDNIPEDRIEPYILEAQQLDLKGILGKDLYNKLFEEVSVGVYYYPELKDQYLGFLCYSTYARFLGQNQITVTSHGVVQKKTDFSDNLDDKMLTRIISQARANASVYGAELVDFLNDNTADYPEWKSCCNYKPKTGNFKGNPSIGAVKGKPSQWL